ncbi:MAG: PaaI family thioesterase [Desulfobacteraceae bacterium]|nr:PaaI family thioesterase [Desulfobacteraceae bacterium]
MSFQTDDPNFGQKVRDNFEKQHFMKFIGARLQTVSPGMCEIILPYKTELTQQDNFFHAGIISTMADNAAGYAAYSLMEPGVSVLSVEFKLNLLCPGDGEELISRGEVIKKGRSLTICRSEVFNVKQADKTLCATALLTMMGVQPRKGPKEPSEVACPLPP